MVPSEIKIQELVESLKSLSESDLQFIPRIVRVLGKQESDQTSDVFDEWAYSIANIKQRLDATT